MPMEPPCIEAIRVSCTRDHAMKYLLYKLRDAELPTIHVADTSIPVPLFEIACNPRIFLKDLKGKSSERIEQVRQVIREAYVAMSKQAHQNAQELKRANPDAAYIVVTVRTDPHCLSVDKPSRPIYDPPGEWDDEKTEMVVPEGAKVVGHTEPAIGWVFHTILGLTAVNELPDGRVEGGGSDTFPFWIQEPNIPTDLMAYMQTPQGKAELAVRFSVGLGYGPPPPGALLAPEELNLQE